MEDFFGDENSIKNVNYSLAFLQDSKNPPVF